MTRPWTELVCSDDAIELIRSWSEASATTSLIVQAVAGQGRKVLERLQVSTRSPLGAIALHTGGVVIDDGWLRVLGSGSAEVPRRVDEWNGLGGVRRCDLGLLVADDVVGGFFCWFESPRTIHYLAPDTLEWEDLKLGYTDWLRWCFGEGLADFYRELRWEGWQTEVRCLPGDRGMHISPPLFTEGPTIVERSRRPVPVDELWSLALDVRAQLRAVADDTEA
ncbi:MAG: DUF2625 family protein [Myxococcales bacterium]|nr:DUF2625 family protein [Myxococcales bacterium]